MVVGVIKNMITGRKSTDKSREDMYDEEIAAFVNQEYESRKSERLPFELQWRLNIEFLNDNQFLDIDPTSVSIQEIPKMYWYQEREVFNQMATIYETRVAQLSRTIPMLKVRPASQDDGDISAARVSSSLLQSTWYEEDMDVIWDDLCAWTELTGTALIKNVWNKDKGRTVMIMRVPKEQQENKASNGDTEHASQLLEGEYEDVELKEGDMDVCVVSPFEFFPDNNFASSLKACHSVIHAKAYGIKDIEEIWGVKVEPEKVDVMTLQQMQAGLGGIGYSVGGYRGKSMQLKNHAIVKEYYERPTKKYPNGRFIVVANNKVLSLSELPYKVGDDEKRDFPFVLARSIKKPAQFWGGSVLERIIPIQRRYNALRNRKAEYLNLVSIGQWYEPEGALDEDVELDNSPGNIIRYRPVNGGKPEPVSFPNLPASFENEIQTLLNEFTAISGVSELSRYSQAPSGVKSGVALSIANEQDNTRISNTAANLAQCIKLMGKQWLRLYRQFVKEPRVLRTVGRDRDVEVSDWTVSQLKSDDVIIENSSALAETPAQRRQMVFDMLTAGLFNKEETSPISNAAREKILEMLEYGNWEGSMMEMQRLQEQKAKRENMRFKQGQPIMINDYDDDVLHIEMHNRLRMSAEYEDILNSPQGMEIDQMLREHIEMHRQRIMMRQMEQLQQQIAAQQSQTTINGGKNQ
ncbi:hypothetical protein U2I53_10620 [Lysinibacillus capsici]|uniref:portal protein n=1 Tax=Lysinibacillus capsici TaxID=2115968 RepID=UPI0032DE6DFE